MVGMLKEFKAAFFNISGGFRYHIRAMFQSSRRWKTFRNQISDELFRIFKEGKFKSVLWIGSSGGYCVDLAVFNSIEKIHVFEIDPIARIILRIKFFIRKRKNVVFSSKNVLCPHSKEKMSELKAVASSFDLVLFSNVLGQLPFIEPTFSEPVVPSIPTGAVDASDSNELNPDFDSVEGDSFQWFLRDLENALSRSNVVSFHDLFSAEIEPDLFWAKSFMGKKRSEIDFKEIYKNKKKLEVVDHEMWGFMPKAKVRSFYVWPLSSKRYQWIELAYKPKDNQAEH